MNRKTMILACVMLGTAGLLFAQDGGGRRGPQGNAGGGGLGWGGMSSEETEGMRTGMMIERIINDEDMIETVGLTEDQIKTLTEGLSEIKKEQWKIRADLEIASLEQADKVAKDKVDEEDLMKTVESIGELRTQLAKLAVKQMLLIKNTLTADQIKKIKETAREMRRNQMNQWRDTRRQDRQDRRGNRSEDNGNKDEGSGNEGENNN